MTPPTTTTTTAAETYLKTANRNITSPQGKLKGIKRRLENDMLVLHVSKFYRRINNGSEIQELKFGCQCGQ